MSIIFHDYKVCICKRIKKFQKITLKFLILKFNLWEKFSKFSSTFGKSFGFWRKYLPLTYAVIAILMQLDICTILCDTWRTERHQGAGRLGFIISVQNDITNGKVWWIGPGGTEGKENSPNLSYVNVQKIEFYLNLCLDNSFENEKGKISFIYKKSHKLKISIKQKLIFED